MKTLALVLAVAFPLAAIVFLAKCKATRSWQHYALLTVLTIYVSVLLLGVSGNLASFGYGEAKVEFVAKKAQEINDLVEQMRKLAQTTAEVSVMATEPRPVGRLPGTNYFGAEISHYTKAKEKIAELLRQAGRTESDIERLVEPLAKEIQQLEAERAKEEKPNN